jgi:hypothetical protein
VNEPLNDERIWQLRLFIYRTITDTERAPTVAQAAAHFDISSAQAQRLLHELHQRHAIFLNLQNETLQMANPYAAVPTRYRVRANGHSYWANCAWDAFGIPAMLACDAQIVADCAEDERPIHITIRDGQFAATQGVVHFPLPFARWYDDLVFT